MFGPSSRRTSASRRTGTGPASGVSIGQVRNALEVGARRTVELHDEIERRAAVEDAPDGRAGKAGLDRVRHILRAQAVARDRPSVQDEPHERNVHLLLERQIDDPRHAGHARSRTCSPRRRSVARSSPKTLTAMLARVPDSM